MAGVITAHLREAGLGALADLGLAGLDDDPDDPVIVTGRKATRGQPLTTAQKQANQLVSRERAANEHGFADLKNWRVLTKVRMNARQAEQSSMPRYRLSRRVGRCVTAM